MEIVINVIINYVPWNYMREGSYMFTPTLHFCSQRNVIRQENPFQTFLKCVLQEFTAFIISNKPNIVWFNFKTKQITNSMNYINETLTKVLISMLQWQVVNLFTFQPELVHLLIVWDVGCHQVSNLWECPLNTAIIQIKKL